MKVYIEELTMCMYSCDFEMYLNLKTLECDYDCDKENEKGWIKIPTIKEKEVVYNYAYNKVKNEFDNRFSKVLKSKDMVQTNHFLIYKLGMDMVCDYMDYTDEYVKKEAINWCINNNFPYTLEEMSEEYRNNMVEKEKKRIEKFIKDLN